MLIFLPLVLAGGVAARNLEPRLDNGLALTPPMGWNSYNHYSCSPNEAIIHSNAAALVSLGLADLGYKYVTVDCGWTLPNRTAAGTLTPNPALFPSGYTALGNYIHGLGLKFGVYGDAGIQTCMTGTPAQAGSRGYEAVDAQTFASWGADLLKYDNCYSDPGLGFPNTAYHPTESPQNSYAIMTTALANVTRPILFQICNWGVSFPTFWAPRLGNSWRISNDIIPSWTTIPRILNQAVVSTGAAAPGQWPDLDMLEVGNNVFTVPEEQTHFAMWSILKSPLVIGAALKDTRTSISAASLAILKNKDVISYNQDSLGVSARFVRRFTQEGYEIWTGPLSNDRVVAAVINLKNTARTLTLDLPDINLQFAAKVKNIWAGTTSNNVLTSYSASVQAHGTILLELSGTVPLGLYTNIVRSSNTYTISKVYGKTTSNSYLAQLEFTSAIPAGTVLTINGVPQTIATESNTPSIRVSLAAGNTNTVTISGTTTPLTSLNVYSPNSRTYPAPSFALSGTAVLTKCLSQKCVPVGSKVGYLTPTGSASIVVNGGSTAVAGKKYVEVLFCNNDIAFDTAWTTGTNTRNLTISVNGMTTRIELPLAGRESEVFSGGLGWQDTDAFGVLLDGFVAGNNTIVVSNAAGGLVNYGADLVRLGVFW